MRRVSQPAPASSQPLEPSRTQVLATTRAPTPHERTLAALSHVAIAFGLFGIGFLLGLVISIGIWIAGRRSRYIAVHAEQAGLYQLVVLVLNVVIVATWLVTLVLVISLCIALSKPLKRHG